VAGFRLLDIYSFDIVERTVTANVVHYLTWTDDRISLKDNCRAQIFSSDIFALIWLPDLDIDHFRTFKVKSVSRDQKFLSVRRRPGSGQEQLTVSYSFWASVTISCSMNLDRYPFADTTCRYRMTSQSLDTTRLLFAVDPSLNVSGLLDTKESFQ
jgi:hypothetical protein